MNRQPDALGLEDVFTEKQLLVWLDAQEQWARSIPKTDPRYHYALVALDLAGQARVRLALNVRRSAAWNAGGVDTLALQIDKHHSLAASLMVKKSATDAGKAKSENAESRIRQIAGLWKSILANHPGWTAKQITIELMKRTKLTEKALERPLANARKRKLIPARHARKR